MMKSLLAFVTVAASISLTLAGCNSAKKAPEPLTVQETIEASLTARVTALDHTTRIITLQDQDGDTQTFRVGTSVQRLNEVLVGDNVITKYKATLLAELRPPTAAEAADPIAIVMMDGRAPQGNNPAAGSIEATRVVTTVEAVDVPNMRVTLRGPLGDLVVVKGRHRDNVKRLKVGDTIVITYTSTMLIALEKVAPR